MAKKNKLESRIVSEIKGFQNFLMGKGLMPKYNSPIYKENKIKWAEYKELSILLKISEYEEIYKILNENKNYSFQFIDGSIFQLSYTLEKRKITKMRLTYYPRPNTLSYEKAMEDYDDDNEYMDMIDKYVVSSPIRIDYAPKQHKEIEHPKVHIHFGQIEGCRIPMTSPIMPNKFFKFIFYNFYNNVYKIHLKDYNFESENLEETITNLEKNHGHLHI